jgi:outer membrane lipoprotein-sorting protein
MHTKIGLMAWVLAATLLILAAGGVATTNECDEPKDEAGAEDVKKKEPDYLAKLPPELQRILKGLDEANAKVKAMRADVAYEREIELLDDIQKAKGYMEFLKPDMLHLKLGKPRNEEVYTDGKLWWIIDHDDKQVEIYEASGSEGAGAEAAFLTFGVNESANKLLARYEVELVETITILPKKEEKDKKPEVRYRLKFVPRDKKAPAQYAAVEVELPEGVWLPSLLVLYEADGEIVHRFRFTKFDMAPKLKPKDFIYKRPRGYEPFDMTRR